MVVCPLARDLALTADVHLVLNGILARIIGPSPPNTHVDSQTVEQIVRGGSFALHNLVRILDTAVVMADAGILENHVRLMRIFAGDALTMDALLDTLHFICIEVGSEREDIIAHAKEAGLLEVLVRAKTQRQTQEFHTRADAFLERLNDAASVKHALDFVVELSARAELAASEDLSEGEVPRLEGALTFLFIMTLFIDDKFAQCCLGKYRRCGVTLSDNIGRHGCLRSKC